MRKGRDGGKWGGGEPKKTDDYSGLATTSLPAVDCRTLTAGTPHARAKTSIVFF